MRVVESLDEGWEFVREDVGLDAARVGGSAHPPDVERRDHTRAGQHRPRADDQIGAIRLDASPRRRNSRTFSVLPACVRVVGPLQ